MDQAQQKTTVYEVISYVFIGSLILLGFLLHLMPMLIAGFVIFFITNWLYKKIKPHVKNKFANSLTIVCITVISILAVCGFVFGLYYAIQSRIPQLQGLQQDIYRILQQIRDYLPTYLAVYIPEDTLELQANLMAFIKSSSSSIVQLTSNSAKLFVQVIIGLILGALIAFSSLSKEKAHSDKPLIQALKARLFTFTNTFSLVIFAQIKIASINTIFTAIYFFAVLPLFSIHMPYGKTMVLLTFILGLIPIIGNLIVNVIVVAISLTVDFRLAIASLVFLVMIHKLEYYINARVVGGNLKISVWEILIAMIILESLFGVMGVVLGPVVYGYLKEELKRKGVV